MSIDYLGRGAAFPFGANGLGGIAQRRGADKVRDSILMILGTEHHERVMRPEFGCNLKALVHAPNNAATANLARHYVTQGLGRWEPRIELQQVVVENDNAGGRLIISVHYRIKSTYEMQNLIYPFYLEPPVPAGAGVNSGDANG